MLASTGHAGAWPTQSTCPSTGHAVTWTHTDQLAVAGSRQKAIPTGGTAGKRGSLPSVRGTQHTEAWHSPGAVSHATGTQDTPVVDTASRLLPQAPERLAGRRDPGSSMVRGALAARAAATAAVRGKSCTSPCMPRPHAGVLRPRAACGGRGGATVLVRPHTGRLLGACCCRCPC